MIDRTIYLAAGATRCRPRAKPCVMQSCARGLVADDLSRPLGDFPAGDSSRDAYGGTSHCPGYIDVAKLSPPAPARRVHPPIGSVA